MRVGVSRPLDYRIWGSRAQPLARLGPRVRSPIESIVYRGAAADIYGVDRRACLCCRSTVVCMCTASTYVFLRGRDALCAPSLLPSLGERTLCWLALQADGLGTDYTAVFVLVC